MTNDDTHRAFLALLVWREARGEPIEGKLGVANVVRNRVDSAALPDTWEKTMSHKWSFSSFTAPGDLNLVLWPDDDDPTWRDSMEVAERVYDMGGCDNTFGSTLYCNLDVVKPSWLPYVTFMVKIGKHSFFRE